MAQVPLVTRQVLVTPAMAQEWLARNTHNRKMNKKKVSRYAHAMRQGRWFLHHQGIAFDSLARLADDQHRLQAIVESETSQPFLVTDGVPSKSLLVIDVDDHRRALDNFQIEGASFPRERASRSRFILHIERPSGGTGGGLSNVPYLELKDISKFYSEGLEWSFSVAPRTRPITGTSPILATMAYCYPKNRDLIAAFAQKLLTQEGLVGGQPEHTLFRYLMNQGSRQYPAEAIGATLQALYFACQGRSLMRVNTGFFVDEMFTTMRAEMLAYFGTAYPKPRKSVFLVDKSSVKP